MSSSNVLHASSSSSLASPFQIFIHFIHFHSYFRVYIPLFLLVLISSSSLLYSHFGLTCHVIHSFKSLCFITYFHGSLLVCFIFFKRGFSIKPFHTYQKVIHESFSSKICIFGFIPNHSWFSLHSSCFGVTLDFQNGFQSQKAKGKDPRMCFKLQRMRRSHWSF